jgi:hypothetical protein
MCIWLTRAGSEITHIFGPMGVEDSFEKEKNKGCREKGKKGKRII